MKRIIGMCLTLLCCPVSISAQQSTGGGGGGSGGNMPATPEVKVLVSALSPQTILQSAVSTLFIAELQTGIVSFQPVGISFRVRIKEKRGANIVLADAFRDIVARSGALHFTVYTNPVQPGDTYIYADLTGMPEMSPYDTETVFFTSNFSEGWENGDEIEVEQLELLGKLPGFAGKPAEPIRVRPDAPIRVTAIVQGHAAKITFFSVSEGRIQMKAVVRSGARYWLEWTEDLKTWHRDNPAPLSATLDTEWGFDLFMPSATKRFFRVVGE